MISLSGSIADILETERKLGRSEASIKASIRFVIEKLGRKYRLEIAKQAASVSGIPLEFMEKRGAFFLNSGRGGNYGVLSFLTLPIPSILLNATQNDAGVETTRRFIPGGFIRNAQRFGGGGRRDFVFRRKGKARYPISEMKEDTYGPFYEAISQLKPEVQQYLKVELEREFSRAFIAK